MPVMLINIQEHSLTNGGQTAGHRIDSGRQVDSPQSVEQTDDEIDLHSSRQMSSRSMRQEMSPSWQQRQRQTQVRVNESPPFHELRLHERNDSRPLMASLIGNCGWHCDRKDATH